MSNDDTRIIAIELLEKKKIYEAAVAEFAESNPELFSKITKLRSEVDDLESALKGLMRVENDNLEIGSHTFKVSHSTKKSLDIERTLLKASKYDHIETLIEYGVLTFKGDPNKISILPEEIRGIYEREIKETKSTRVTIPKSVKRSW